MPIDRHVQIAGMTFIAPFFIELCVGQTPEGRLPSDREAHALWHYFQVASHSNRMMTENLVEESAPSRLFDAVAVFKGIAHQHQVDPNVMIRYWPVIQQQRIALGLTQDEDLPLTAKITSLTAH